MNPNRQIFSGMKMLTEGKWLHDHALVIEEGSIKGIIANEMIKHHLPAKEWHFPASCFLIPGLIDLHIHGANGADVMDGTENALQTISRALAEEGVTGFLATTMTASDEKIEEVLSIIANVESLPAASLLGVHLEGPFLAQNKAGAQSTRGLQKPNLEIIKKWQKIAKNQIKIMTFAPELPDAAGLIKLLQSLQIVPSIGHTDASFEVTASALQAGVLRATHLFNAMRSIHQRDPGVITALLLDDQVTAEIIVDGKHLHPAIVDLIYRLKGRHRLNLVSDAIRAKCLGNGHYELGGQTVTVHEDTATLPDGTLAGSTLKLTTAIRNMAEFSHCSLHDAIVMATINPARTLGLQDKKGKIALGMDADLAVMDASFTAVFTMCQGKVVYRAE